MNNNSMTIFLQMMGMGDNPEQIMQNIAKNTSPEFQKAYNQYQNLKKENKSNQELVMQIAKENGFNIQPMINLLKRGNRI